MNSSTFENDAPDPSFWMEFQIEVERICAFEEGPFCNLVVIRFFINEVHHSKVFLVVLGFRLLHWVF